MIILDDDSNPNFTCEHCDQNFTHFTVNIAVMLYGVAFLDCIYKGYACITCPNCLNTLLIKCNFVADFYQKIQQVQLPENKSKYNGLRYYSSVIYSPRQFKQIKKFDIPVWTHSLSDEYEKINFSNKLTHYVTDERNELRLDYYCSYLMQYKLPMGAFASIWWFRIDDVQRLVEIENKEKIRVFPRYYYQSDFFEKIDSFCWEHFLLKKKLSESLKDKSESAKQLMEIVEQQDLDFNKLLEENPGICTPESVDFQEQHTYIKDANFIPPENELFDILIDDPYPPVFSDHFKAFWKKQFLYRGRMLPNGPSVLVRQFEKADENDRHAEMVSTITENHKQKFLDYLSKNHIKFIKDYIEAAKLNDFSYGAVWGIKLKYLEDFLHGTRKGSHENAQYAFYQEGPTWTITFGSQTIRGLEGKGFKYIHHMIMQRGKAVSTRDLMLLEKVNPETIKAPGKKGFTENKDYIEIKGKKIHFRDESDYKAYNDFKKRFKEIEKNISEGEAIIEENPANLFAEKGYHTIDELYQERDAIEAQINKDFFCGRTKKAQDNFDNDRDAVGRAIQRAIKLTKKHNSKIYEHLNTAIVSPFSDLRRYSPLEVFDWE